MIFETFYATNMIQVDQVWPKETPESTWRVTYVVGQDSSKIYNDFIICYFQYIQIFTPAADADLPDCDLDTWVDPNIWRSKVCMKEFRWGKSHDFIVFRLSEKTWGRCWVQRDKATPEKMLQLVEH